MRERLAAVVGMVVAGCGGPAIPFPACPDRVNATFNVLAEADSGQITAQIRGQYDDWPSYGILVNSADGCTAGTSSSDESPPDPCGGECDDGERCFDGTCEPLPEALDVGVVRFTGFDGEVALSANDFNGYRIDSVSYQPGAEITVAGGGQGTGVEAFSIEVAAVSPLSVDWTAVVAPTEGDLVVTWDVADSAPGTRVHFSAHARRGFCDDDLDCWSDDTGQMTIPAEQLANVLGPTSGDVVTSSFLRRISVGAVETEHGCGILQTMSTIDANLRRE